MMSDQLLGSSQLVRAAAMGLQAVCDPSPPALGISAALSAIYGGVAKEAVPEELAALLAKLGGDDGGTA